MRSYNIEILIIGDLKCAFQEMREAQDNPQEFEEQTRRRTAMTEDHSQSAAEVRQYCNVESAALLPPYGLGVIKSGKLALKGGMASHGTAAPT
ncbi:hypothetical protein JMJ77_0000940 [Colletotrichum scovillei]|uniref:Uncharacterized protein n=1 Tax=Colletotrichum scovillei TaxID=1209932 RepID=A0A9P7UKH3_9PEZI|nr:hypothetical protein JMJ77_0000940 [Colletotrichum scovillei]KAG7072156.1 hypothetical protein JMJ76_0005016 [Colletotrichum scovillei]KAG7080400.1 hypothetical protein JMJ78_0007495 [Colletotrichum scovillei]